MTNKPDKLKLRSFMTHKAHKTWTQDQKSHGPESAPVRAFHFYFESVEMLSVFVFAAKRMVKVMPL